MLGLTINIPPVADVQDNNNLISVINVVDNPVIPRSNPPAVTPCEFAAAVRPGNIC